jgi:gluconolactonase
VKGEALYRTEGIKASSLTILHNGSVYAADPGSGVGQSKIWRIKLSGEKVLLDSGLTNVSAIAFSPDNLWLAAVERTSHWGYIYRVQSDGTLTDNQRFYWFHVPDSADDSGASALAFDRDGRLYAATRMGVQVLDRNGRSRAILPLPENGEATSLCFGGKDFDTLFVTAGGKVYSRKLRSRGAPAWEAPIKLPGWGAG